MLFKSFQKAVSIFLCISFLTYDFSISWGQDAHGVNSLAVSNLGGNPLQSLFVESIKIPNDIGEIVDQNIISGRPLLFLLEDIHCNTEVQKNIQRILKQLEVESSKLEEKNKNAFRTSNFQPPTSNKPFYIFSEAASGEIDMSFFTAFPDQKALAEAQKKFLMNHDLNGLESFLISEGDKAKGWGVEDVQTYVDNAKAMGSLMEEQELQEQVWADLEETFKNLRQKLYPKELWELMEKREKYREYKIGVEEYLNQISKIKDQNDRSKIKNDQLVIAGDPKGLQKARAKQSQLCLYPSIQKFLELQTLEKKTDASKIESEYLKFLSKLEKKLPKEELNEVLKNVLEHRLGRVSDEEHYLFLSKYLGPEDGESFSPLKLRGEGELWKKTITPPTPLMVFASRLQPLPRSPISGYPNSVALRGEKNRKKKNSIPISIFSFSKCPS